MEWAGEWTVESALCISAFSGHDASVNHQLGAWVLPLLHTPSFIKRRAFCHGRYTSSLDTS